MEPALSFHSQPSLKRLVDALTTLGPESPPITIVCGAGVSIDSGLPDWKTLVDRMCAGIQSEAIAEVVRADPIDSLRKVDYIVRMRDPRRGLPELVQDALYESMKHAGPGPLADSVAKLVASLGGRARVVTTNFDHQLERALLRYFVEEGAVRPVGLFTSAEAGDVDLDDFERSIRVPGEVSVLHLHGMVAPGMQVIEPLILSESYFLRFGAGVKDALRGFIEASSLTIFVGVSLADPNVVGPLNDLQRELGNASLDSMPPVFLLTAPDEIAGQSFSRVQAYTDGKCRYYEQEFGVCPILLKSYGQVTQTMYELSVALADPEAYCVDDELSSTRYGFRLDRALSHAYAALSLDGGLSVDESRGVSDALSRALGQIESQLAPRREHLPEYEIEENGLNREGLRTERFALFLWLRLRSKDRPHEHAPVPFSLRLVGSSAYSYRSDWLLPGAVPIEPGQTYAAARAAYLGTAQLSSITRASPWRTNLAVPIVVPIVDMATVVDSDQSVSGRQDADRGPVTIGVVSLDSTHALGSDPGSDVPRSILSALRDVDLEGLAQQILAALQREAFGGWPVGHSPSPR